MAEHKHGSSHGSAKARFERMGKHLESAGNKLARAGKLKGKSTFSSIQEAKDSFKFGTLRRFLKRKGIPLKKKGRGLRPAF